MQVIWAGGSFRWLGDLCASRAGFGAPLPCCRTRCSMRLLHHQPPTATPLLPSSTAPRRAGTLHQNRRGPCRVSARGGCDRGATRRVRGMAAVMLPWAVIMMQMLLTAPRSSTSRMPCHGLPAALPLPLLLLSPGPSSHQAQPSSLGWLSARPLERGRSGGGGGGGFGGGGAWGAVQWADSVGAQRVGRMITPWCSSEAARPARCGGAGLLRPRGPAPPSARTLLGRPVRGEAARAARGMRRLRLDAASLACV